MWRFLTWSLYTSAFSCNTGRTPGKHCVFLFVQVMLIKIELSRVRTCREGTTWHYVSEHVKVTETGTKMRCSLEDIMEIWKNLALNAWRHPPKDLDRARKDLDSCVSRLTAAPKGLVSCVTHIRPRLTSGYVRSLHVVFVLCVTRFRPRLTSGYICSFHVVVTQTVILLFYRPVLSSAFVVVVV